MSSKQKSKKASKKTSGDDATATVERKYAHVEEPRPSKAKDVYDLYDEEDANAYPFREAVPEGFNFATMKTLKKRDFVAEKLYYEHKAQELLYKASVMRKRGEEAGTGGGKKAKRLLRMQAKMVELRAQLASEGIDVDALLGGGETD